MLKCETISPQEGREEVEQYPSMVHMMQQIPAMILSWFHHNGF